MIVLDSYFLLEQRGAELLSTAYSPLLVGLSYLVAVLAAFTTLGLVAHMRRAHEEQAASETYWWLGGAFTLGGGIFAMHFVGMIAFSIPVTVRYDLGMTVLSLLVAVGGSAIALRQLRGDLTKRSLLFGGLWMGTGVAAMHYIGMASLLAPVLLRYLPDLWLLSIAVAVVVSWAAMLLLYLMTRRRESCALLSKVLIAAVMGAAVAGMHYTGMAAAAFYSGGSCGISFDWVGVSLQQQGLGIEVAVITLLILLTTALLTSVFTERLNSILVQQNQQLEQTVTERTVEMRDAKEKVDLIIETMGEGIAVIDPEGRIQQHNHRLEVMSGFSHQQLQGMLVSELFVEGKEANDLREMLSDLTTPLNTIFGQRYDDFEALCADAPIAMMLVDDEGVIHFSNRAVEQLTGWTVEALEGNTLEPMLPEAMRAHHRHLVKMFMKAPEARRMQGDRLLPVVTVEGEEREVEIGLVPLKRGEEQRVLVLMHQPHRQRDWELFKVSMLGRMIEERSDHIQLQYKMRKVTGEKLPVEVTVAMTEHAEEHEITSVLVVHDMTAHVKQGHRDQYEAFQAGIAEMSATVLHNIGNVLMGLSGGIRRTRRETENLTNVVVAARSLQKRHQQGEIDAEKLQQGIGVIADVIEKIQQGDPAQARAPGINKSIRQVEDGMYHATEIIRTFRENSKNQSKINRFNLKEMVQDTLDLIEDRLQRHRIALKVTIPEEVELKQPRNLTMQMLLNLVKNSFEAIQARKVSDHDFSPHVVVRLVEQDQQQVVLVVEDNGCGVSEADQSQLFQRGYTTKESGSGIGLDSIANYLSSIGGEVRLESGGVNQGAAVYVTLPLEKQEVQG